MDYAIFIFLLMFKVYLFAEYTGLNFLTEEKGLLMVSLGSVLLLSFWTLFLSRSARLISLYGLNILLTFIVISDLVYFRYFSDVISIPVLFQIFQVSALGESIANLFRLPDIWIVIDLVVLIPVVIYLFRKVRRSKSPSYVTRVVIAAATFAFGYYLVFSPINAHIEKWGKNLFLNNWSNTSVYNVTGLLAFHANDAYRYINDFVLNKREIPAEQKDRAKAWFAKHEKNLAEKTSLYGAANGKNVIVFQAEAFQNFVIGQKINGKEITPNLNKLMKESLYFKNFYHQVGQGRTSDAEFMTNCSLYPLPSGSVYIRSSGNEFDCLPEIFKANGYETAAFHAYEPNFWNRYAMYRNMEFDHFFSIKDFKMDEKVGWALGDESLFRQSLQKMKKMDQPVYSLIVGLSSHHPFIIASKYKTLDLGAYEGTDFGNYIHALHYVDYAAGKMVELMKAEGIWDETVFVFYGDHDSGTMRDGGEMATFVGQAADPLTFLQMQHQVPLFIHLPNDQAAGVYNEAAGQLDLAPTLMHLLGIPYADKYMMGSNILDDKDRLIVFRYGSFTDGKVFYKNSLDGIYENGTCYNVSTGQEIEVDVCRPGYDQARERLRISDNVILGNLIKEFRNNK
jgi:lipoteichoic acid synthase